MKLHQALCNKGGYCILCKLHASLLILIRIKAIIIQHGERL